MFPGLSDNNHTQLWGCSSYLVYFILLSMCQNGFCWQDDEFVHKSANKNKKKNKKNAKVLETKTAAIIDKASIHSGSESPATMVSPNTTNLIWCLHSPLGRKPFTEKNVSMKITIYPRYSHPVLLILQPDPLTCTICKEKLDSRNKLFQHIQETGG